MGESAESNDIPLYSKKLCRDDIFVTIVFAVVLGPWAWAAVGYAVGRVFGW